MGYKYRETVLNELAWHGVIPDDNTPPELIHDFINDLYLFEIRALKKRLLDGLIPREEYAARVAALRESYPVLSLPVRYWVESD